MGMSDYRRRWSINEIEQMIRWKVYERAPPNRRLITAYHMFGFMEDTKQELSPEDFRVIISQLCGDHLTLDEVLPIFDKYDADGGGTLDPEEFVQGVLVGIADTQTSRGAQFTPCGKYSNHIDTTRPRRVFRHLPST